MNAVEVGFRFFPRNVNSGWLEAKTLKIEGNQSLANRPSGLESPWA